MEQLSDHHYIIDFDTEQGPRDGQRSGALVTFEGYDRTAMVSGAPEPTKQSIAGATYEVMMWGKGNDLPVQREGLLTDNNICGALLTTKRSMLTGAGLYAYTERFESGARIVEEVAMPTQIKEDLARADIKTYLREAAGEIVKHAGLPVELLSDRGGTGKIAGLKVQPCRRMRMARRTARGTVDTFLWGSWKGQAGPRKSHEETKIIPRYDPRSDKVSARSMMWQQDELFTDGYYAIPYWWGAWEWIDLANRIPRFHLNNLSNGFNIRYHIEVPDNYFKKSTSAAQESLADAQKAEKKAKADFIDLLNNFFRGVTNAGRVLVTTYQMNVLAAKEFPGVKINVIDNKLQDDAMLKLFDSSNTANISAQAIHPTLAAIETAGKLSSGSEIRNAYKLWLAIHSHWPRDMMMNPVLEMGRRNGWPTDVLLGIKDVELATLDDEPSGKTERIGGQVKQDSTAGQSQTPVAV